MYFQLQRPLVRFPSWYYPYSFTQCLPIAPINLLELLKPCGLISGLKSMVITVRV